MATIATTELSQVGPNSLEMNQGGAITTAADKNPAEGPLSMAGLMQSGKYREAIVEPPPSFSQRIWDVGNGVWVFYTGKVRDNPASSETTPNHSGNLDTATHEVLGRA